jgi:YesN/AraC family two-component response regulator
MARAQNSGYRCDMKSILDPRRSISILLVEDEKITRDLLTTILGKKYPGVPLHTATNGRTGLELFKTHMPEIVVTDINMPEMNGMQMADKIRAIKPDTKFIVLTGDTGKISLEKSVGNGFIIDHYIAKPLVFQELFAAIEECIGEIGRLT